MEVKFYFFFILSLIEFITLAAATDYCSLCEGHVACNNDGSFGENCPSDVKIAELSSEIKNAIVAEHNKLRNKVASGDEPHFKKATQMNVLVCLNYFLN